MEFLLVFFTRRPFQDPQWLLKIAVVHCCSHSGQKILPVIFCTQFTEVHFILLTMLLSSPSFSKPMSSASFMVKSLTQPLLEIYPDFFFSSHFLRVYVFSLFHSILLFDNFHIVSYIGILVDRLYSSQGHLDVLYDISIFLILRNVIFYIIGI